MKTAKSDRSSVIGRKDSICIASSEDFKAMVVEKAKEMGITVSSLARMALNEFIKNH
jgi:antitoxin component of RelBE/YafQ-DinJ toxin-antitoxin module